MTDTQFRVMLALKQGARLPHELYPVISPGGRFNKDIDTGSSKGGPSRTEYAANMYMGRLEKLGWCQRFAYLDKKCPMELCGKWVITPVGYKAIAAITELS